MKIGYARVSCREQNLESQIHSLEKAGCAPDKIFKEKASGAKDDRPELNKLLSFAREGDIVIITRLDRLGRSLPHLVETINKMAERKIMFQSLSENIDTTSTAGKLVFHIFCALAEFERGLIRERTRTGLAAAIRNGVKVGRPKIIKGPGDMSAFMEIARRNDLSAPKKARLLGISERSYFRIAEKLKNKTKKEYTSIA